MAKNNNKGAKSAAEQAAAQQAAPGTETTEKNSKDSTKVNVIQVGDLEKLAELSKTGGMDHNHIMDMIRVQHETFRMDPKAAEHTGMSQDAVDKINRINAIEQVALMASVVTFDQTPFAISMRQNQLEAITEAAAALGITIDQKALPAPDKDGKVELPSTAIKISSEKKKEIKAEKEAAEKKVITDPTKIESEDQLKDSLLSILVKGNGSENFYDKVGTAINFYEAYLTIQANKSDDKEAKLAALKEKSRCDFLTDISVLLGKCPFSIGGMAKFMYEQTERTKNPVVAFCTLRNASLNKKTGMPQVDDSMLADIVKVLIRWYANSEIQETNDRIAGFNRDLELLKKDEKKNAKAIEQGAQKIKNANDHIAHVEEVISFANVPSRTIIDSFAEDYMDSSREGYKFARMMGSKILESYYPGIKAKEMDQDNLVHNLTQYMGIIFNFFLPAMQQLVDFSEAKITELKKAEDSGEKPEEPKN